MSVRASCTETVGEIVLNRGSRGAVLSAFAAHSLEHQQCRHARLLLRLPVWGSGAIVFGCQNWRDEFIVCIQSHEPVAGLAILGKPERRQFSHDVIPTFVSLKDSAHAAFTDRQKFCGSLLGLGWLK